MFKILSYILSCMLEWQLFKNLLLLVKHYFMAMVFIRFVIVIRNYMSDTYFVLFCVGFLFLFLLNKTFPSVLTNI